jgi:mannose-6-phosphate isomerase-like protein (cupin superfamily)
MQSFDISELVLKQKLMGESWFEFLRVPALSMGLYKLPAGGTDSQDPHAEDEVYYALSGRGMIRVGATDHHVEPGSVLFVEARAHHRFHSITEDLTLLVFFAPAEGSTSK